MTNEQQKTTFDLEPNPFERSFASKDSSVSNASSVSEHHNRDSENSSATSSTKSSNKHNLHIPNLSTLNGANNNINNNININSNNNSINNSSNSTSNKLPGITPPLFTPGGRRLPPLGLSPPVPGSNGAAVTANGTALSNPGTPGSNLWNSLLSATNNHNNNGSNVNTANVATNGANANVIAAGNGPNSQANFNQFVNTLRKTGLTPNESNLRSGLTPGILSHQFSFGAQVPGLTTPSALLNSPMTPGLSSLLGLTSNNSANNVATINSLQPTHQQTYDTLPSIPQEPSESLPTSEPLRQPMAAPVVKQEIKKQETSKRSQSKKRKADTADSSKGKRQKADSAAAKKAAATRANSESDSDKESSPPRNSNNPKSEDEKRKSFLERNRVAASKCRLRKKQLVQKMEDELAFYSTGYRELSAEVNQLRDSLITLKSIIENHKGCALLAQNVGGFDQIERIIQQANYIAEMSNNSSNDVTSIPSTIPTTLHSTNSVSAIPARGNDSQFQAMSNTLVTKTIGTPNSNDVQANSSTNTTTVVTPELAGAYSHATINHAHGMSDMPQSNPDGPVAMNGGNGELRAINSMSNLSALNTGAQAQMQQLPHPQQALQNYSLRPVSSMVELQQAMHAHGNLGSELNV
ncbi:hypothetical protein G9P44_004718 [Scheffersomyces stipitis]|nr:hypothetical protein G9P44_004718 [Scheffersomyces stipitis]